ncbi:hypothetical protein CW304_10725 [Bacillus sp. UFRGS-B20]|nr:hypothetical protein CW304_10725 [Bacillus sp. UFRGS-B20]
MTLEHQPFFVRLFTNGSRVSFDQPLHTDQDVNLIGKHIFDTPGKFAALQHKPKPTGFAKFQCPAAAKALHNAPSGIDFHYRIIIPLKRGGIHSL